MLCRKRAAQDMGSPTVFTSIPTRRTNLNAAASFAGLFLLSALGTVEASGQRPYDAMTSTTGAGAMASPLSAEPTSHVEMREGAVSATIHVRLLDLSALTPSAFGDWDPPAVDQPQK